MSYFAAYDATTGSVHKLINAPGLVAAELNKSSQEALYEGYARDDLHWIDPTTGERQDRQEMNPSVTTNAGEATLTGLPDPCEVRCLGKTEQATGGTITIEFDEPGTYTVELRSRPQYLDHTIEVEVP